ncbi:hypothetical protein [Pedobacter gandavensis]|uniref:hypothetical protein n=1 Tax=Pedobacter gandavensis TaxID=2679963 RepID=UPI00292D381F|nr:hypothetical protein [Pedobacter gandavensis]
METKVKASGDTKVVNSVKEEKNAPQFVAGNPVNIVSKKVETEKEIRDQIVNSGFVNVNEEAKKQQTATNLQAQSPYAEPTTLEIKAGFAERIAKQRATLERHIKLGDELARKIKHRDNLKNIITTLEEFELELKDNVDETDGNYYQGCLLTIKDDKGRTFTTKNPTIIRGVAEQVNNLCADKLEEVELDIVNLIPA